MHVRPPLTPQVSPHPLWTTPPGHLPEALKQVLDTLTVYSPYLAKLARQEKTWLSEMAKGDSLVSASAMKALFASILSDVSNTKPGQRREITRHLVQFKHRLALLTAIGDLAGWLTLEDVCETLSDLASRATQVALDQALHEAHLRGDIELEHPDAPARGTGIVVIGMGKHGAGELNYSSDIDLIVFFDPARLTPANREGPMAHVVRATRTFCRILDGEGVDGYVFRTDLRLRPHPGGQPLALAIDDAENYYQHHGQNWERAAYIKADIVAGDFETGREFLDRMRPFVWRKYLDASAIADIHSIKRQIDAFRGHGLIKLEGHDLKVGRGGIREIEFFAQTQQLILGGREPELRHRATKTALATLAGRGWVDPDDARILTDAYHQLRMLEHRLQMIRDEQTHVLPTRAEDCENLARFSGYETFEALGRDLLETFARVEKIYAALFEASPGLGTHQGSLVFTGTEPDEPTLQTLREMGYARAEQVWERLSGWHHGHVRAMRSTRARELLTELTPTLLSAIAEHPPADAAFERFDRFLTAIPGGVQLFSIFHTRPDLMSLTLQLLGAAPALGDALSRNIDLFERLIHGQIGPLPPDRSALESELELRIREARNVEDVLDICRRWLTARQFELGVAVLQGREDHLHLREGLMTLAELILETMLKASLDWLSDQHGMIEDGRFVVLAVGKLGSRELTFGSDLDLIFIYDCPDEEAITNGNKPLRAPAFFSRLGQRLVRSLSAPTAEGLLYEIDTRLRPSGNSGPVATSFRSFIGYQCHTADTWEHQVLTRARVVAGDASLAREVQGFLPTILGLPRDDILLKQDISAMRERIFKAHGSDALFAVKQARGGTVDCEFLAQYLQLTNRSGDVADWQALPTRDIYPRAADAGLLTDEQSTILRTAVDLYARLGAVLRLAGIEEANATDLTLAQREALCVASQGQTGEPLDFDRLCEQLSGTQRDVRGIVDNLLQT